MKTLPVFFLAAFLVFSAGCSEPITSALGPSNEVTIVTPFRKDSPAVEMLRRTLEREIVTVQKEKLYKVEIVTPDGLERRRSWRNLILLADLGSRDRVTEAVWSLVPKAVVEELKRGEPGFYLLVDVWAKGQTMLVIAGEGEGVLEGFLDRELGRIFRTFDQSVTERTRDILFFAGRNESMMRYLGRSYGWTIGIPKDANVAEDGPGRFVKIVMREPVDRFLFVYWEPVGPKFKLDEDWCVKKRGEVAAKYYEGDEVDLSRTKAFRTTFQGREAVRIEGVWQNQKLIAGGPFRTYCFVLKGRLYVIDSVVFAPARDKGPHLRQLEALSRTFRDLR